MAKRTIHKRSVRIALLTGICSSSLWFIPASQAQTRTEDPALTERARQERIRERRHQLESQYKQTTDKRSFLLEHLNEPDRLTLAMIARELGNYSGPDVIAALQKLSQYPQPMEPLMGDVAADAQRSMNRVTATPDVARLTKDLPLVDALPIIQKYPSVLRLRSRDYNGYADSAIRVYLTQKLDENPREIVPILVYRDASFVSGSILKYPQEAKKQILENLRSPRSQVLEYTIQLIERMKSSDSVEFLPIIVSLLYPDYNNSGQDGVSRAALKFIRAYGDKAVPHLEIVLYSRNQRAQKQVITILGQLPPAVALPVLLSFQKDYAEVLDKPEFKDLNHELDSALKKHQENTR